MSKEVGDTRDLTSNLELQGQSVLDFTWQTHELRLTRLGFEIQFAQGRTIGIRGIYLLASDLKYKKESSTFSDKLKMQLLAHIAAKIPKTKFTIDTHEKEKTSDWCILQDMAKQRFENEPSYDLNYSIMSQ